MVNLLVAFVFIFYFGVHVSYFLNKIDSLGQTDKNQIKEIGDHGVYNNLLDANKVHISPGNYNDHVIYKLKKKLFINILFNIFITTTIGFVFNLSPNMYTALAFLNFLMCYELGSLCLKMRNLKKKLESDKK